MNDKENTILRNRIRELAAVCWQRDIPTATNFLGLEEQTVFHSVRRELPPVRAILDGGFDMAERKAVCFLPSYAEEGDRSLLPVCFLTAKPADSRFAEELTHRDYLGALMNLGIERGTVGDLVMDGNVCHLVCLEKIAGYLIENYRRVRHTDIVCAREPENYTIRPHTKRVSGSVASKRVDAVIAMVFRLSRTKTVPLLQGGKVYIDGKETPDPSAVLREGQIVSVSGFGKFRYAGGGRETKKGRIFVDADVFD
jgi:RNA-binding protein YlmH